MNGKNDGSATNKCTLHLKGARETWIARVCFYWFLFWALLVTIPLSLIQFVTHRFAPTARNFKRWSGIWARLILRGAGIRTRVELPTLPPPDVPYVVVSNHQNLLDILVLAAALPYPFGFIAKAELERIPFLGFAIRNSASLFIDRSEPRKSVESLRRAAERIRTGNSVLVFPEGSRSYAPTLLDFKKGAFAIAVEAGVHLLPVTIVDAYRCMDERHRVLRPGRIHLVVGSPISTEGLRRKDIPALMDATYQAIDGVLKAHRTTP